MDDSELLPGAFANRAVHMLEVRHRLWLRAGNRVANLNAALFAQGGISLVEYAWALYEFRDNPRVANSLLRLKDDLLELARSVGVKNAWEPEDLLEVSRVVALLLWMRQACKAEGLKARNCLSSVANYALSKALDEYRGTVVDRIPLYFLRFELYQQVASDAMAARDCLSFVAELIPLLPAEARPETSYMLAVKYLELWHPVEWFKWRLKSFA